MKENCLPVGFSSSCTVKRLLFCRTAVIGVPWAVKALAKPHGVTCPVTSMGKQESVLNDTTNHRPSGGNVDGGSANAAALHKHAASIKQRIGLSMICEATVDPNCKTVTPTHPRCFDSAECGACCSGSLLAVATVYCGGHDRISAFLLRGTFGIEDNSIRVGDRRAIHIRANPMHKSKCAKPQPPPNYLTTRGVTWSGRDILELAAPISCLGGFHQFVPIGIVIVRNETPQQTITKRVDDVSNASGAGGYTHCALHWLKVAQSNCLQIIAGTVRIRLLEFSEGHSIEKSNPVSEIDIRVL